MALVPIRPQAGICKVHSPYAAGKAGASGRYIDGNGMRFVAGFPEKVGGHVLASTTQMVGTPRAVVDFRKATPSAVLGIGTEGHLYVFDDGTITDITPFRTISTGTLTDAITTVISSTTATISDASQHLVVGDNVFLSATNAVGGVLVKGWFAVRTRTPTTYTITLPVAASSSAGPLGGAIAFSYPRRLMAANPFATVSGSSTVTVTDAAHGATTNDYVTFYGSSAVGGITTLNGEFKLTVLDAGTYTINAGMPATSTVAAGGGAAVTVTYNVFIPGLADLPGSAFGVGPFGIGPFGKTASSVNSAAGGVGWTLAAYGTLLLAAPIGGTIYVYDSTAGLRAYPVLNAPATVLAIFVTPERFLFALGINSNAMEIAWPDQNDITNWTTLPTNTANSGRSFQGGTFLVGGVPVANGVSLFFSNRSTFQASYTGDNEIYATPLVSDQSGLIGPQAITTLGGVAFWMSDHDFWTWNGTVSPMMSDDIRDYVFRNINTRKQSLCFAATNRAKKEVWFSYPSIGSNEIDSYVIAHLDQPGAWSIGTYANWAGGSRTAWRDSDLLTAPYAVDAAGHIYLQETTRNANGAVFDAFIEMAPTDISNGDRNMDVFGFIPDFERLAGSATLTIEVKSYPQDIAQTAGPFTITDNDTTPLLDFRCDGKLFGFRLESNVIDGDFRFGVPRANVQPGGARL